MKTLINKIAPVLWMEALGSHTIIEAQTERRSDIIPSVPSKYTHIFDCRSSLLFGVKKENWITCYQAAQLSANLFANHTFTQAMNVKETVESHAELLTTFVIYLCKWSLLDAANQSAHERKRWYTNRPFWLYCFITFQQKKKQCHSQLPDNNEWLISKMQWCGNEQTSSFAPRIHYYGISVTQLNNQYAKIIYTFKLIARCFRYMKTPLLSWNTWSCSQSRWFDRKKLTYTKIPSELKCFRCLYYQVSV